MGALKRRRLSAAALVVGVAAFDFTPALTFTSTTAYYDLQSSSSVNPTLTTAAGPTFAVTNEFSRTELTQEFRLDSNFSGPLNFTLGAFYEDGELVDRVRFIRNTSYIWLSKISNI